MTKSQIDSLLEETFDRGERLGRSQWVSKDERTHAIKTAKSALYELISKEVIGQDGDRYYADDKSPSIGVTWQNNLRATQRESLNELFGVKENI